MLKSIEEIRTEEAVTAAIDEYTMQLMEGIPARISAAWFILAIHGRPSASSALMCCIRSKKSSSITKEQIAERAEKGTITEADYQEITGEEYGE